MYCGSLEVHCIEKRERKIKKKRHHLQDNGDTLRYITTPYVIL